MPKDNTTSYIILGLLTHQDMSGYDVKKRIDASISYFWDAGYGQIYPTLKVLEKEGLVTKKVETKEKRPDRIVYTITDTGKQELTKWLSKNVEREYLKYEVLLKLFFGSLLPESDNIKKILEFKSRSKINLQTMDSYKEELSKILEISDAHKYYYLTVLFGQHIYKAYMDWADEAVTILENKPGGLES